MNDTEDALNLVLTEILRKKSKENDILVEILLFAKELVSHFKHEENL